MLLTGAMSTGVHLKVNCTLCLKLKKTPNVNHLCCVLNCVQTIIVNVFGITYYFQFRNNIKIEPYKSL